jgi:hypothetical protein
LTRQFCFLDKFLNCSFLHLRSILEHLWHNVCVVSFTFLTIVLVSLMVLVMSLFCMFTHGAALSCIYRTSNSQNSSA